MPQEVVETRYDTRTFEVAIYRNDDVDARAGTAPEETIVNHLSPALSAIDVNHRIRYGFSSQSVNNNNNSCPQNTGGTTAYEDWADWLKAENVPFTAKDSNVLLTDSLGGGCGSIGGNVCVAPGGRIDRVHSRRPVGGDEMWTWNVYATLHEIGHNMGWGHEPHPGTAFVDHLGLWNKTPCVGVRHQTENLCGETIPADPDPDEGDVPHNYYHDCVAQHIDIKEPTDTGTVEIIDLSLTPNPVTVGENVTIQATMQNTTSSRVERDEPVLVGDDRVDTLHFDVGAGETQTLSTVYTTQSVGEHLVQVNQGIETLVVEEQPTGGGELVVTDVSVDPSPVTHGETATITVTGENLSEAPVSETVDVFVNGEVVSTVLFEIPGQGVNRPPPERSVQTDWVPDSVGSAHISAGSVSTTVTVQARDNPPDEPGPPVDPGDPIPGLALAGGVALLFLVGKPEGEP